MANKDFKTELTSHGAEGESLPVTAMAHSPDWSFVSLRIGRSGFGEFAAIISPAEARAIAIILNDAADFAETRETAPALGDAA